MVRGKPSNQSARQVDFTPLCLRDRMNKMDRMDDMGIVALHYDYEGRGVVPYSRGEWP